MSQLNWSSSTSSNNENRIQLQRKPVHNTTNPVTRHKIKKYHYPCQPDLQTIRWIRQKTIPKCHAGHAKLGSKHSENNKPPHNWTWAMRAMGGRADPDIWAVGLGFAGCARADGRKRKLPEGLGVHWLPTTSTLTEWRKTKEWCGVTGYMESEGPDELKCRA